MLPMTEKTDQHTTKDPAALSHQEAQDAWVAAEAAVTAIMRMSSAAIRDRPPFKDFPRFHEYQSTVMAPLIAERDAARSAAKAAKQAMFEARTSEGA